MLCFCQVRNDWHVEPGQCCHTTMLASTICSSHIFIKSNLQIGKDQTYVEYPFTTCNSGNDCSSVRTSAGRQYASQVVAHVQLGAAEVPTASSPGALFPFWSSASFQLVVTVLVCPQTEPYQSPHHLVNVNMKQQLESCHKETIASYLNTRILHMCPVTCFMLLSLLMSFVSLVSSRGK